MTSFWLSTHPVADRATPLSPGAHYDVAVVGAGLTGLATAVMLATAGQRTCLVEARTVGAVATGNTTAKLSLLQGTVLSALLDRQGAEILRAYVTGNLAGQAWLRQFLTDREVPVPERTAYTYANTEAGRAAVEAEFAAAATVGLPVTWAERTELPYPVAGAIQLTGQSQLHPTQALDALLAEFIARGGVLHTGTRVRDVDIGQDCRLITAAGEVRADQVVLATGTPILDRGGHFARLRPERSYALAFQVPDRLPPGMYLSVDAPSRSLRTAAGAAGEVLIVGGGGHLVGRHHSPRQLVADLQGWTAQHFPGAVCTHAWSAQDYAPSTALPMVDTLPWSKGRVQVATGYHKWGMTNAVAAALRLVGMLGGEKPAWAEPLRSVGAGCLDAAKTNLEVAQQLAAGWIRAESWALPEQAPAEGRGILGRLGGRPACRSTVAGQTCTVSAVCTHLGGVLAWNDAELSWDCPLHGSRFDAAGRVLEGPATSDLQQLPGAGSR